MLAAILIAASLGSCETSYHAGREAVEAIDQLYVHPGRAVMLANELRQALTASEFENVCDDPQAFALAFTQRANIIGGGEAVRMRPRLHVDEEGLRHRPGAASSGAQQLLVFDLGADGIGRLAVADFPPLQEAALQIESGLADLQSARSLVLLLGDAYEGDTETALALFEVLAPRAAVAAGIRISTRHGESRRPPAAPASWRRLGNDLQIFVVVSEDTGPAGQALATLLRLYAGALVIGQRPDRIGDLTYQTVSLDAGFEIDIATSTYRLAGTDGWPVHALEPDLRAGPASQAWRRAEELAAAAADRD